VRRLSRLPIAARVTLAFTASMAVVLVVVGVLLRAGLSAELVEGVDEALETRAAAVGRLIEQRGRAEPGLSKGLDDPGESFTQVIGPDGDLLVSTPGLPLRPVLARDERSAAAEGATIMLSGVEVAPDEGDEEIDTEALEDTGAEPFETRRARVLARRLELGGDDLTIVVGATYEDHDQAVRSLDRVLAVGGPLALVLAALVGFGAVRGALAPVETMRLRAAAISAERPGDRLPVPAGDDELARLGRTLNDMLERLESALERERTFSSDASHELRTPLAIVRGELELVLRSVRDGSQTEAALRSVLEEVERLTAITESLLLLARSDRDELALRRERLDVAELIATTARRLSPRAEQLGREVRLESAPGPDGRRRPRPAGAGPVQSRGQRASPWGGNRRDRRRADRRAPRARRSRRRTRPAG
jgi:two-component system, OmpR family, sensor kinase